MIKICIELEMGTLLFLSYKHVGKLIEFQIAYLEQY